MSTQLSAWDLRGVARENRSNLGYKSTCWERPYIWLHDIMILPPELQDLKLAAHFWRGAVQSLCSSQDWDYQSEAWGVTSRSLPMQGRWDTDTPHGPDCPVYIWNGRKAPLRCLSYMDSCMMHKLDASFRVRLWSIRSLWCRLKTKVAMGRAGYQCLIVLASVDFG